MELLVDLYENYGATRPIKRASSEKVAIDLIKFKLDLSVI